MEDKYNGAFDSALDLLDTLALNFRRFKAIEELHAASDEIRYVLISVYTETIILCMECVRIKRGSKIS
jgi:hypothetical protein